MDGEYRFILTTRTVSCATNQSTGAGNKIALNKLLTLFEELTEHPFTATGKPEPLKHMLSGMWSRMINKEHRLVYEIKENTVIILSAKGHY